jgi:glycosyltransferase involved in cell wall biosynthesis
MKDLRIVIPAYNEEAGLAETIDRVKQACPESEIVVVDDASKDATAQIARGKDVKVISNATNRGKGGATKIGLKCNTGRSITYLAFIDADSTYPPESIPKLYQLCKGEGFQLAIGSRFLSKNTGMPMIRKIGNRLFAIMLSLYSGKLTTDTSTGLRVFNIALLPLLEATPDGLDFDTAMTAAVLFEGLKYTEVPIDYYRRVGNSKLSSIRDGYRFLNVIMKATRKYRPVLFFYTLGIPFIVVDFMVKIISALKAENVKP